jgi:steroid delta-isomerase-like uncharacterized protein
MAPASSGIASVRLSLVREHIALENAHDLDGIMHTFGDDARYDDEPWDGRYVGRPEVRSYYAQMLQALPDLGIDVQREHIGEDALILEVRIRGRHQATWRGLPATGRTVDFPLCGIFTFDAANRLAGERIYYDRATVLAQLGVFFDPESWRGRIATAIMHPLTIARALLRAGR